MAYCLITSLTDAEIEHQKHHYGLGQKAENVGPYPTIKVPKYQDAGKARALAAVIAERQVDVGKTLTKWESERGMELAARTARDMVGQGYVVGYRILATEGHWLIGQRDAAADGSIRGTITPPAPVLALTPDHWRAYARVRTCRPARGPRTSAWVSWTVSALGLTFDATDGENTATETVPGHLTGAYTSSLPVKLDDAYVWPLRGVNWAFGVGTRTIRQMSRARLWLLAQQATTVGRAAVAVKAGEELPEQTVGDAGAFYAGEYVAYIMGRGPA